ncbi:MAG: IS1634 family transposase [Olsenella sp.]
MIQYAVPGPRGGHEMFLKKITQKSGRTKLCVYESYREGARTRQRTVRALGYADELAAEHDDPVAWAESAVEEMNAEREAERQSAQVEIHPMQLVDKRAANRRNAGCAAALAVYSGLGIEAVLRNRSRGRAFSFDLSAVMRLLVVERILEPGSKRAAWERRGRHFFRCDLSLDDVYRGMDELAAARDSVVAAMNRAIASSGGRDASSACYDVTNYYFECDPDGPDGLRERGVSKERRPLPIARMGMLQDADGVPISYRLFRGNTTDGQTMVPVLADMKAEQGIGRVVAVADKGLNNSDNIAALVGRGDGWTTAGEDFRTKSMQGWKTLHLRAEDTADGRARDERVPVKWIALWSGKYDRRAKAERARVIERARDLVAHPGRHARHTHHGAASYVRNVAFDDDGSVATNRELSIDEGAIAEAERYDGYYLICTSEVGWDDGRVLDTYRELWRIEESFRVTKSELEARPVFVWTTPRIEAHFLTCYVGLVILRLLQRATGIHASRIREEIAAMSCSALCANWWLFDHRTDESDAMLEAVGVPELRRKNMRTGEVRAAFAKAKRAGIPRKKKSSA